MAESALKAFVDEDQFLRRVRFYDHLKHNLVHWRAFKDNDPQFSLTFRDESLRSEEGLDAYHEYFSRGVGETLPAILWFAFFGLTRCIEPPLEPQHAPDRITDPVYGHLHCLTERPHGKPHMQVLAKLVNDGNHAGIAKRYPKPG
ncbi:MAG: hypothetical protein PVI86_13425 [Phycisphaerae bacterium]|jgi:hypothetical protein